MLPFLEDRVVRVVLEDLVVLEHRVGVVGLGGQEVWELLVEEEEVERLLVVEGEVGLHLVDEEEEGVRHQEEEEVVAVLHLEEVVEQEVLLLEVGVVEVEQTLVVVEGHQEEVGLM